MNIKFLESTANLSRVLKKSIDREPSAAVLKNATVCLQHGRLYFEAAEKAPMEIRPLLIFYGMENFARSLVVARNLKKLEALYQAHGVQDTSKPNAKLEDLTVKILDKGIFQEFNDSIRLLDGIFFYKRYMTEYVNIPTSSSELLSFKTITLKEILARIPGLESLYCATFEEEAKTVRYQFGYEEEKNGYVELRIDDREIFTDIKSRISITDKWKSKYPFLNQWYLIMAECAWDNSNLLFANVDKKSIAILSKHIVEKEDGTYYIEPMLSSPRSIECSFINFLEILNPAVRGLTDQKCLIEPFNGIHISELSLYYLGMFLLSSLVRYRPQIWNNVISRSVTSNSSPDDTALALIEEFMEYSTSIFSDTIVKAISMQIKNHQQG